jgi:dienelactone hydrolase
LLLCAVSRATTVQVESVIIPISPQQQLLGQVYVPKTFVPPYPVMVLCHGVSSTKETMAPLAVELARRGIAAVTFDLSGYGESLPRPVAENFADTEAKNVADLRAVVAFVRSESDRFDSQRIGIGGHSMGGAAALALTREDRQLQATVLLGMGGAATTTIPRNLFLGIGLYEQLNPPQEMRSILQAASSQNLREFQLAGDFKVGTARLLVISATADHLLEPYDPFLIQQATNWVESAFALPVSQRELLFPWQILGSLLTWAGGLATSVSGLLIVAKKTVGFRRWISIAIAGMMLITLVLATKGLIVPVWGANLLLFSYTLLLLSGYALYRSEKSVNVLRIAGLYGSALLIAYGLIFLLSSGGEILAHPAYLFGFPQFLFQWPLASVYNNLFLVARSAFFLTYSLGLQLNYSLPLLILPEIIVPGITLILLKRAIAWLIQWLRQPVTFAWQASFRSMGLVVGLVIFLVGILYYQSQSGLLSFETAGFGLSVVTKMVVLPLLLFVGIVRSPQFRHLEKTSVDTFIGNQK